MKATGTIFITFARFLVMSAEPYSIPKGPTVNIVPTVAATMHISYADGKGANYPEKRYAPFAEKHSQPGGMTRRFVRKRVSNLLIEERMLHKSVCLKSDKHKQVTLLPFSVESILAQPIPVTRKKVNQWHTPEEDREKLSQCPQTRSHSRHTSPYQKRRH